MIKYYLIALLWSIMICINTGCSNIKTDTLDVNAAKSTTRADANPINSEKNTVDRLNTQNKIVCPNQPDRPNSTVVSQDTDDILILVNKKNKLPKDYIPENLCTPNIPSAKPILMKDLAARALEELFTKANSKNIQLVGISGYRSAKLQALIYNHSVAVYGKKHTSKYVATSGSSEHQTGLAIDISSKKLKSLTGSFENTKEGEWIKHNAAEFGFIIRYPKGKEKITDYGYEPWHIRYVGKKVAREIMNNGLTLEEYVNKVN